MGPAAFMWWVWGSSVLGNLLPKTLLGWMLLLGNVLHAASKWVSRVFAYLNFTLTSKYVIIVNLLRVHINRPVGRPWCGLMDNIGPCGSSASQGNRTDFPLGSELKWSYKCSLLNYWLFLSSRCSLIHYCWWYIQYCSSYCLWKQKVDLHW